MKAGGIAIGVCGLVCAAACAGGEPGPVVIERDGVRLLVAGEASARLTARVGGNVAVGAGDCVGLEVGGTFQLAVWPSGTRLAADGRGIELPRAGLVRLGEPVTGTGGYGRPPFGVGNVMPEISEECLTGGEIATLSDAG